MSAAKDGDRPLGERDSFARARGDQRALARAATPAQRLAWLEEMLEIAWRSGALERALRHRMHRNDSDETPRENGNDRS